MKKHIPVYRPIFKRAAATAWHHRELWPFAAVAGLAGTGAVINDILREAKIVLSTPSQMPIFDVFRDNIILANFSQISLVTVLVFVLLATVLLLITACQQIILRAVHRTSLRQDSLSFREIFSELWHPRLLRFLTLDLFLKLIVANIVIASTVLLSKLSISTVIADAFFGTVFSLSTFFLALIMNILVMLALVGVARKDLTITGSLVYAWDLFRRHPFICLEISFMLFAANFAISFIYDGALLVIGVPSLLSFSTALQAGSFGGFLALTFIVVTIVAVITVAFAGFATTFTYSAWVELSEYLGKGRVVPRTVEHTKRFIHHLKA